jgi:CHAT domain-containing protein
MLPFQALMDGEDKFLVQRFSLSYAPSIRTLVAATNLSERRKRKRASWKTSMLAIGRSTFTDVEGYRGRNLPWAATQAQDIARLYNSLALPDELATEGAVKLRAKNARYLHFATHAELNVDAPLYSAIVLGRSGREDGLLYARELMEMDLKAELVTLAACETGAGKDVSGEGLMGPAWAVLAAGTQSAVVTQWKVQDRSMTELMLEFYRRLRAPSPDGSRPSKAESLRQAQLKLLQGDDRAYRHPYHWAASILIGDWR